MKKTRNTFKKLSMLTALIAVFAMLLAACGAPSSDTADDPASAAEAPAEDGTFDTSRVIGVHTREDGSGTRDAFVSITGVGDDMYEDAVVIGSSSEVRAAVSGNEYAIGYLSVGSLNDEVKALSIEGVIPSDETIYNGSYQLQRPLLVCVTEEKMADPLVADFIDFMLSTQGQANSETSWTSLTPVGDYEPAGLSGELRIGGSTSVEPLMQMMSESYREMNPDVSIDISATGSSAGISGAVDGELDIGMSSRELRDGELETLIPVNIALDGVAVIVNPANPIANMTIEQVRAIFTGEVTRWDAVN